MLSQPEIDRDLLAPYWNLRCKTYKDFIIASLALIPQLTVHNVLITMALVMFAIKDIFCQCHHILAFLELWIDAL